METTTIKIKGMTCMGCVKSVTGVLERVPGVSRAEVSLERAEARIDYDAAQVSEATLRGAIDKAGFEAA